VGSDKKASPLGAQALQINNQISDGFYNLRMMAQ